MSWPRVASLKSREAFLAHLAGAGITLPFDDVLVAPSPLARAFELDRLSRGQSLLHPAHGRLGRDAGG